MKIKCFEDADDQKLADYRNDAGAAYTLNILSGKWNLYIFRFLSTETLRFSALKAKLDHITSGALTKQLQELEQAGMVKRQVYPEIPPRVEYSLTAAGQDLLPVIAVMRDFGLQHDDHLKAAIQAQQENAF